MSFDWGECDQEMRAIKQSSYLAAWAIINSDRDLPPLDVTFAQATLARRINEMAQAGECDQLRLTIGAVSHFRQMLQIISSKRRVEHSKHRLGNAGAFHH
jgi:hypothetical protein